MYYVNEPRSISDYIVHLLFTLYMFMYTIMYMYMLFYRDLLTFSLVSLFCFNDYKVYNTLDDKGNQPTKNN
jgi:hypothetical protein